MRFWQKLYLSTLSLFLIVFVFSILMVTRSLYENNLEIEKAKGNRDAFWLEQTLSRGFEELPEEQQLAGSGIEELLNSYYYDYTVQNSLFSLYNNMGELLYSNLDFDDSSLIPEISTDSAYSKVYWMGEQSFYCIYLPISANPDYYLLYLHEMATLRPFINELSAICLTAGITGSLLLAFLLYYLVKMMTKPLGHLDLAAQKIASGEYDTYVKIEGRDEFATVSQSFNTMAAQVGRHIAALKEENEKKQLFIDNLAHEMNTPLTSIRGYGQYLQHGAVSDEERYEALAFIVQESTRLSSLGKQLLLLADLRQGDFDFTPIKTTELIHKLEQLFAERIREKEISLTFSQTIPVVIGEATLLESLAANFIENAIRACNPGGHVRVSFEKSNDGWSLRVEDDGKGIPEDALPYLMEPFYRTDKARSRADGGTGLGLALCRQIAALHHGTITISSHERSGTCAIFTTS